MSINYSSQHLLRLLSIKSILCVLVFASSVVFIGAVNADLTTNGNFEAGDTSSWVSFPSSNSSFDAISSPASDVYEGGFSGRLENLASGSAAIIKQANLGVGVVQANTEVTISFLAKGSAQNGGVQFAEFFSEIAGGGVSKSEILGGGPLFLTDTYTMYEFVATTGADVSGGITLQLAAVTGANVGSTSTIFIDNVVVRTAVPEPTSAVMIGLLGLGLVTRRRRG